MALQHEFAWEFFFTSKFIIYAKQENMAVLGCPLKYKFYLMKTMYLFNFKSFKSFVVRSYKKLICALSILILNTFTCWLHFQTESE